MVSTRLVILLGFFVLFAGIGSPWVAFGSASAVQSYDVVTIASTIGQMYGPCGCPPQGDIPYYQFLLLLVPATVAPGPLLATAFLYPAALVVTILSFFRWKLMLVGGLLSTLSGVAWSLGFVWIGGWYGGAPQITAYSPWIPVGPYFAVAAGVILVGGFMLTIKERLDSPLD